MASIQKTKNGYRIQYYNRGNRLSATFPTQRECREWLAEQQHKASVPAARRVTVEALLNEYETKVTSLKRSRRNEEIRIAVLKKRYPVLMATTIGEVTKADIASWRDDMLATKSNRGGTVKSSTILRYWTTLHNAFEIAITDWGWILINPMKGVTRPKESRPRDRIILPAERDRILYVTGYTAEAMLDTVARRVAAAFLFSLETAMRAGEIRNLKWTDVSGRVARVADAKTRAGEREVPLSREALRLIEQAKKTNEDKETIFNLEAAQLDANFRKYRTKAGLSGFTFHDARATAITSLSKKLDILELAKAIGHKNLEMLMVYYRESAESLAAKLD